MSTGRKLTKKEFQAELAALADTLRRTIEAGVDGWPVDADASAARRAKVANLMTGYQFFVQSYFPHYITSAPSAVHLWLFEQLPRALADPRGRKVVVAAPRGEAKTTLAIQLLALWCIVTASKHYIVIVMDAYEQTAATLEAIKIELEANPRLQQDYPDIAQPGRIWKESVLVTANDVKVEGFGAGKRLRGRRHGPYRPDLALLDDLENDENVRSPEQRDKLERWLNRTVLKLGPADDSMDVIYLGTILHYDSVLARTLRRPLWQGRRFKALIEMPHNLRLWDQWEEVLRNQGEDAADQFYAERRAEMDAGAVVSWPAQRPLLALMKARAQDHDAFDSEYQNDPVSSADAAFGEVVFWVNRLRDWVFYGACDPSLGRRGQGRDPSAILVGGFVKSTGVLDVVEASVKKRLPDRIISDIIELQREYRCVRWAVEAVQFQEFLRSELVRRSAAEGCPVPAEAVNPHDDKQLRIEGLQPHVKNGLIRFHASQVTLLEQLRHFPHADHDDGPDALEMLFRLVHPNRNGPMFKFMNFKWL